MYISKEQLLTINYLALSGKIDDMNDNRFDHYCKTLDAFIEQFPVQESALKNSFEAKNYDSFSQTLSSVQESLTKVQANGLAQDCLRLLNEVGNTEHNIVETHLTDFLTAMSTLSIDIQMARHKNATLNKTDPKSGPVGTSEENTEGSEPKSILAVDDLAFFLNVLKSVLQNTKYKFIGVTSGVDALKFMQKRKPDLFILDIEMPVMNGYELAKKIKESGQTAPIIFLTGNAKQEYVLKAIQAGAADFIVKPINKDHVLNKIRKFIG